MVRSKVPAMMGGVMLVEAAAFVIGSLSHIPLKIGPLDEPTIIPAMVVEALCAIALTIGGITVLRNARNCVDDRDLFTSAGESWHGLGDRRLGGWSGTAHGHQ